MEKWREEKRSLVATEEGERLGEGAVYNKPEELK